MIGVSAPTARSALGARARPPRPVLRLASRSTRTAAWTGVRELRHAVEELGVKAATALSRRARTRRCRSTTRSSTRSTRSASSSTSRSSCAGVPGPTGAVRAAVRRPLDEVCWYFPELKFVTRHGCEPWADLAVKLLLKWPNLYYSTSAFAPKYYPKAIVNFANTRGADKVMYAGYFPMGLSLDRIFTEMPDVPFRDHVWPEVPPRERAARARPRPDRPTTRSQHRPDPVGGRRPEPRRPRTRGCSRRWCRAAIAVLVVRGEDGGLRAFTNTCRHDDPYVAAERKSPGQSTANAFTCPLRGLARRARTRAEAAAYDRCPWSRPTAS